MTQLWLFLHFLGFTAWLGGGFAAMVAGLSSKKETRSGVGAVVRAQSAIHKRVAAPGAALVVLSGLILTIGMMNATMTAPSPWLMTMQGAGILGALVTLLGSLPVASRLARLDPEGQHAALFDDLRSRQKLLASVAGTLAMVALVSAALM